MTFSVEMELEFAVPPDNHFYLLSGTEPGDESRVGTHLFWDFNTKVVTWAVASPYEDAQGSRKFHSTPLNYPDGKFTLKVEFDPEEDVGDILLDGESILDKDEDAGAANKGMAAITEIGWRGDTAELLLYKVEMSRPEYINTYDCTLVSEQVPDDDTIRGSGNAPDLEFPAARWALARLN